MKIRYVNQQDKSDPMNGVTITGRDELSELLDARRNRVPFIADLVGDNGFELMIGIGFSVGCAQYSRTNVKAVDPALIRNVAEGRIAR